MRIELVPARPTGRKQRAFVFREHGRPEVVDEDVFTVGPDARRLRARRLELRLGLGEAAQRIGVSAVQLSQLERGRLRPKPLTLWGTIIGRLEES